MRGEVRRGGGVPDRLDLELAVLPGGGVKEPNCLVLSCPPT